MNGFLGTLYHEYKVVQEPSAFISKVVCQICCRYKYVSENKLFGVILCVREPFIEMTFSLPCTDEYYCIYEDAVYGIMSNSAGSIEEPCSRLSVLPRKAKPRSICHNPNLLVS